MIKRRILIGGGGNEQLTIRSNINCSITITYSSQTITQQLQANTDYYILIPKDVTYTIICSDVSGYTKPSNQSYKATSGNERNVTLTYVSIPLTATSSGQYYINYKASSATVTANDVKNLITVKYGNSVVTSAASVSGSKSFTRSAQTSAETSAGVLTVTCSYAGKSTTVNVAIWWDDNRQTDEFKFMLIGTKNEILNYSNLDTYLNQELSSATREKYLELPGRSKNQIKYSSIKYISNNSNYVYGVTFTLSNLPYVPILSRKYVKYPSDSRLVTAFSWHCAGFGSENYNSNCYTTDYASGTVNSISVCGDGRSINCYYDGDDTVLIDNNYNRYSSINAHASISFNLYNIISDEYISVTLSYSTELSK